MDKPSTSCIFQLRYKIVIYLADRQKSSRGPAPVRDRRLRTTALDKLQQVFMKKQLGMLVCLINILTDTKESLGTII